MYTASHIKYAPSQGDTRSEPVSSRKISLLNRNLLFSLLITHRSFLFVAIFIMAQQYRDDPGSNAPEVHHQEDTYLYPVTDQTPTYAMPSTKSDHEALPVESQPALLAARRGWKRWWILALIGLFIALIAGLVGGF